jgi:hypothetical protein
MPYGASLWLWAFIVADAQSREKPAHSIIARKPICRAAAAAGQSASAPRSPTCPQSPYNARGGNAFQKIFLKKFTRLIAGKKLR